jgi:metal-responsive CopG/Arc/MetJ family transcriptional regulator
MRPRYEEKMQLRLPHNLTDLLETVASRRMVSRSAYCRQALIEKLERDGFCLLPDGDKRAA